jgi:YVTN family beta-propeller protein
MALNTFSSFALADTEIIGRYALHPPNGNGMGPRGIAYDGSQIFIANLNSHTLSVVETSGDVIWSVDVGSYPRDVAVDIDYQRAFVANAGDDTVSVVDSADWNVLDTVPVGREPVGVAVNQTTHRVYVSNQGPSNDPDDTVTIIDASSYEVIDTVSVDGRPGFIAVDELANKIYVMLWLDSRIAVIDGATNAVSHFEGFSIYHGDIAINSATDRLYLLDYGADKVAVFEASTGTYSAQVNTGSGTSRMDIDTDNNRLYVVYGAGVVIVDLDTNYVDDWAETGSYVNPEVVAVAPDQGMFYIACGNATLRQYRTSDAGLVQVEPLGVFPNGVAANGSSGKVYATVQSSQGEPGDVYVMSTVQQGYKLRIPVTLEPESVSVNPVTNRVYVTHGGDPYGMTVIDGATDKVITTIDVRGDETAINPLTNRIYAISGGRYFPINGDTNEVLPMVLTRYSSSGYIAVDPELDRVYVSSTYSRGRLMVHDGTTGDEITYLSLGGTDIAVDTENHIVYAGDWDAGVNVIDGTTNTLVMEIPTPIEARYLAFDPVDRLLYVGDTETDEVVVIDGVSNTIVNSVSVDSGIWRIATDGVTPRAYTANRNAGTVTLLGEPEPLPLEQRLALVAFYESTNGANWNDNSNWLVGDPCENDWYGLSCDVFGSTITGIDLVNNHLSGSLAAELEDLPDLQTLTLSDNMLSGAIPVELASLNGLRTLDLGFNRLSGDIPAEFSNLVNLETLKLSGNKLGGEIPSGFGGLANLLELRLQSNQLSGAVPDQLINLSALHPGGLDISFNGLYTANLTLDDFLDTKSNQNWSTTQTVAPHNIVADSAGGEAATVSWDLIEYFDDPGRYRVMFSRVPGGPYRDAGATSGKLDNSLLVDGLSPGLQHYFVVRAETDSHVNNQNDLISDASAEASATPEYVNEFIDFNTEFDFLTDPLSETPFTALDFNSGFDATQDALVTTMEASTFEPGHLVISSQNASWHNAKDDGVFLGKKVFGDFIAEMIIVNMSAAVGHRIGLMARVPPADNLDAAGPGQDWVTIGLAGESLQLETRSTDNGVTDTFTESLLTTLLDTPQGSPEIPIHLRLQRVSTDTDFGSVLEMSYRVGDQGEWIEAVSSPVAREDIDVYEIEVGIYQASEGEAMAQIDSLTIRSEQMFSSGFE